MSIIQFDDGTKVNFSGTPTQADIEEVYEQIKKSRTTSARPGFIQNTAQAIAKPFLAGISSITAAASETRGMFGNKKSAEKAEQVRTEGDDYGYFGKVKPIGSGFDIRKSAKENVRPLLSAAGTGAEIASTITGGGGAKSVLQSSFKGAVKASVKEGVKVGTATGVSQAFGSSLQDPNSTVGSTALNTTIGGVAGGAGGGLFGGATGILGYSFKKVPQLINHLKTSQNLTPDEAALRDAVETITPKLTVKERELAVQQGRGKTKGFLDKTVIEPSARDLEIANTVKNVVSPTKSAVDNANAVRKVINETGDEVQKGLKNSGLTIDDGLLGTYFDKAKDGSRVIFGADKTLESSYDAIIQEMRRQIAALPPEQRTSAEGLLIARKNFDRLIEQKFPGLLSSEAGDNVRRNAVLDVRRAANEYLIDLLPDGSVFGEQLRRMNLMYDAIEMLSRKGAPQVGKTPLGATTKKILSNPVVRTVGTGAGLAGAYEGVKKITGN